MTRAVHDQQCPRALGYRMPAEWEPHSATWIAWPHHQADWPGKYGTIEWIFAELVRNLARVERVKILVPDSLVKRRARSVLGRAGALLSQVDWIFLTTDRSWTRDYLPSFLVSRRRGLGAVKWRFDGWRRYPDHQKDDAAGLRVAAASAQRCWYPQVLTRGRSSRIVLEGGAIDVDGQGTLMTTESCLLRGKRARHRGLGRTLSERLLADHYAAEKILWLPDGILGDDTSGHVDDLARFVAPARVVLCDEPNQRDGNHRLLRDAREALKGQRDARGRRLEVVPLPMPEPVVFGKTRLPASYANFYVANQLVIVPTFDDPKDRIALGILQELFADRRVVGIHARDLVLGLGTFHCSTQQEPAPAG